MTVAAIDRLFHQATIFEMSVENDRRSTAVGRKTKADRPTDDDPGCPLIVAAERQSGPGRAAPRHSQPPLR